MTSAKALQTVYAELETGIALDKCRQCGCMESVLESLLSLLPDAGNADLADVVSTARRQMAPIRYECLGCEHCYPAVAQNAFARAFPRLEPGADLSCDFRVQDGTWPPVVGEYAVVDPDAPVAVSTLASVDLSETLATCSPPGLALTGKTETENIGIDKIVKNVVASPTLRYLIVAGVDAAGHLPGQTLLALAANGVDSRGSVLGSPGRRPILRNVSPAEVEAFRSRIEVVDMIGCDNSEEIVARIRALSATVPAVCSCGECEEQPTISVSAPPITVATEPVQPVKMDPAGYFVIVPLPGRGVINVEHYAYDNTLLHAIEGATARSLYHSIIENGWVTELSHAAYLGKELARAELTVQHGFGYAQDGA